MVKGDFMTKVGIQHEYQGNIFDHWTVPSFTCTGRYPQKNE
jgi:hypothetical protein